MILQSFITLIILEVICLVACGIGTSLIKKIPPKEMYLLLLCLIFEFLSYFSYSINYLFSSGNTIDAGTIVYSRIGYFFAQCAILAITYAFMLIDFKNRYLDIFEIIVFSILGTFSATYNSLTVKAKFINGSIQSIYAPFGQLCIILFLLYVIFIWVRRFYHISKIYTEQGKRAMIFQSLLVFIVIGIIFMSIYVILVVFYHYEGNLTFIMSGLFTIVGSVAILKNNAFLFITDIQLDSISIIDKKTSLILYSKSFKNNESELTDDPDFLGSIISAINISMSNTIKSRKELAEMNFSDKTVLIYSGFTVNSLVIVSSANLIVKSISQFLGKRFENQFGETLLKRIDQNVLYSRRKDYEDFDEEVDYVRKFLPL